MTLNIEAYTTIYKSDTQVFKEILSYLNQNGYEPLISKAKQQISEIFGNVQLDKAASENLSPEVLLQYNLRRRYLKHGPDERVPLLGDLLFSKNGKGVFYIVLAADIGNSRKSKKDTQPEYQIEIGIIGDNEGKKEFSQLLECVSGFLISIEQSPNWKPIQPKNSQFSELRQNQENKFVLANTIRENELELSEILEDITVRNIALATKRSGGILSSDLLKKSADKPDDIKKGIELLLESKLISQEYVVICNKTSNQVNRVDSKEKIQKMGEMGILCSCGNPIINERTEELLTPTTSLQKMLDQSYWMTARLVSLFKSAGIPEENILLNLHEGAEEIDAFIDLEGTLLMFELKDNEFSMGHAYPFGGRIGLYKPDYAVIVATKGISPDVRDYFKRVKPGAEIVYVGSLKELDGNLQKIITRTRSKRAADLVSQFEEMTSIEIPLAQMMYDRLEMDKAILDKRRDKQAFLF